MVSALSDESDFKTSLAVGALEDNARVLDLLGDLL